VLLAYDAADRLARLLEACGPLPLFEAARQTLALVDPLSSAAPRLLEGAIAGDARFVVRDGVVTLAALPDGATMLQRARFVAVDLETTGLSAGRGGIIEAACVVIDGGSIVAEREVAVVRGRGDAVVGALAEWVCDSAIAGHNVRFDIGFLDAALARLHTGRLASPVLDTMILARRLLATRLERWSLSAVAAFFGTPTEPVHRALPDARATAEILLSLIEVAAERGARTVADLCALSRRAGPRAGADGEAARRGGR
jgi:DNA polymerase-3 subunit epsilon